MRGSVRLAVIIVAIAGTVYVASRALQDPSTFTFFVLESALAISAGLVVAFLVVARRGDDPGKNVNLTHALPRRTFIVLSSLLITAIAAAILIVSAVLYTAPLTFFVTVGVGAGILALNIQLNGDRYPSLILMQVVVLALLVKFYFFYLNPYVYTSDSFLQFTGLQEIGASGHIPENLGYYFYFPGFATLAFAGTALADIPTEIFGIFNFLALAVSIPLVYAIGREIAGPRAALYASLLTVFTVFYFLSTHYPPSTFGIPFLLIAILALLRIRTRHAVPWLVIFWVGALGAFFSHPVNALLLVLILSARYFYSLASERPAHQKRRAVTPLLSYGVAYGGYLAYVAVAAFVIFTQGLFTTGYVPPLATNPGGTIQQESFPRYIGESAIASSSMVILFFFAAYAAFHPSHRSRFERGFLVILASMFILIPAFEFFVGSFALQSSRFLVYLTIPLVLLAGQGLVSLGRRATNRYQLMVLLVVVFGLLGFLSSSSYLTNNDDRTLYGGIPALPTHITASALSSREFLGLVPEGSTVHMDLGTLAYFQDSGRARYALTGMETLTLVDFSGTSSGAFVVLNEESLNYGNAYSGTFVARGQIEGLLTHSLAQLLFSNGFVRISYVT